MKTAFLASILLLLPATVSAQLSADELVSAGQQGVDIAASMGEPKQRCAINASIGDDGYVIDAFGKNGLAAGDAIESLNGHTTAGMASDDIRALLDAIPPSASVTLQVVRDGVSSFRTIQCVDARPFSAPLIAAYAAAAKKDFTGCLAQIRSAPADLQSDWRFMFLGTQCAIHAHAIEASEEPERVQAWISALLKEARYSGGERAIAEQAIHNTEAYFRDKGRLELWSPLNASLASLRGGATVPQTPASTEPQQSPEIPTGYRGVWDASQYFCHQPVSDIRLVVRSSDFSIYRDEYRVEKVHAGGDGSLVLSVRSRAHDDLDNEGFGAPYDLEWKLSDSGRQLSMSRGKDTTVWHRCSEKSESSN